MDMPNLCSVSSREFVTAMRQRWQDLGNVTSPTLEALWAIMADTFRAAAEGNASFTPDNKWRVLEPPTGTGKTQGLCVYAALVMQKNMLAAHPLGMLVVTRTIAQADEIVATIRELVADKAPGRSVVAKHSESRTTPAQMQAADVLVICHEAYVRSLAADRWQAFTDTDFGRRHLTIIDEALAGIVDERRVSATDVGRVLGYIQSRAEQTQFAIEIAALHDLQDLLEQHGTSSQDASKETPKMRVEWSEGRPVDLSRLRTHLSAKSFDIIATGYVDRNMRARTAERVDKTLRAAEGLLASWAYYAKRMADHTLNNADLIVPPHLPGVVVLDATAKQNLVWTLLQDRAIRVDVPPGARRYDNVTVHVARTSAGLGKTTMRADGRRRAARVLAEIERRDGGTRKVLLVCHKDPGEYAMTLAPNFAEYGVATYGAIDGRNDWRTFDTAVVLGMFNRPDTWSRNMFMALQGIQDDDWLNNPQPWGRYDDIRREMERRQLTVCIVQAVNRIRCRNVVDATGSCEPADVFIVLPSHADGDLILDHIKDEMPGIVVKDWEYEIDGPAERIRRGSSHEALLSFAKRLPGGDTPMSEVRHALGLTDRELRRLKETLRDDTHMLTKALSALGVTYRNAGRGRGRAAYLRRGPGG